MTSSLNGRSAIEDIDLESYDTQEDDQSYQTFTSGHRHSSSAAGSDDEKEIWVGKPSKSSASSTSLIRTPRKLSERLTLDDDEENKYGAFDVSVRMTSSEEDRNMYGYDLPMVATEGDVLQRAAILSDKLKRDRYFHVDLLRGLAMVLMAIDHTYESFMAHPNAYRSEEWWQPAVFQGSFEEFFTRQITHPTAPAFYLLMGVGMKFFFDSRMRLGWKTTEIIRWFVKRGFLFILLEIFLYNGQYTFFRAIRNSWDGWSIDLSALWALGWSMIIGSVILVVKKYLNGKYFPINGWPHLSGRVGDCVVVCIIIVINVLTEFVVPSDKVLSSQSQVTEWRAIFFVPRVYPYADPSPDLFFQYPILPWLSVTCLGFLIAKPLQSKDPGPVAIIGGIFLFIFLFLRLSWFYDLFDFGNIRPKPSDDSWKSYYGFFCLCKYPPSITFLCWTISLNLFILCFFWVAINVLHDSTPWQQLKILGQTPLLFYIVHFWVIAFLAYPFPDGVRSTEWVYLEWLVVLFILYPICFTYLGFKASKDESSLWRFL